jgi:transcriptional regulator with XRE-family HTH domain
MKFCEKLVELRKQAELSQPELAEKSGVPLATLRNYEQGRTGERINFAYVVKLAKALGVTCAEFAECEDVAEVETEAETDRPKGKRK